MASKVVRYMVRSPDFADSVFQSDAQWSDIHARRKVNEPWDNVSKVSLPKSLYQQVFDGLQQLYKTLAMPNAAIRTFLCHFK